MANFLHHTYSPRYVSNIRSPTTTTNIKTNPEASPRLNNTDGKFRSELMQTPSATFDVTQEHEQTRQFLRKPRVSAFELYKGQSLEEDFYQNTGTPKIIKQKQPFQIPYNQSTKYFMNNNLTKKANSQQQVPKSMSKINETIKERLNGDRIKITQKPIMFQKPTKGSINEPTFEAVDKNRQTSQHPNLRRFKSPPINSSLQDEFQRILDGKDIQINDRKTEKSKKSKVSTQKVIMTRKQLQIMELRQSLSEIERLRMQQKLKWLEQQKGLVSLIHKMEKQIHDLKDQNNFFRNSKNTQFNNNLNLKLRKLEDDLLVKQKNIRQLENKNTLLTATLISLQGNLSDLSSEFYSQRNILITELNRISPKSNQSTSHQRNLNFDKYCSNLVPPNQHQEESETLKKENSIKEQYIKMLQMKMDIMQKQLLELRFSSNKLKIAEKLIGENNQNIFKFCLRKLDQDSTNIVE